MTVPHVPSHITPAPSSDARAEQPSRRAFLGGVLATGAGLVAARAVACAAQPAEGSKPMTHAAQPGPWFTISLAEWSLHRALYAGTMTNLDFPRIAKEQYSITQVEYVNAFFKDKARDDAYLKDLRSRCDSLGVTSLLIMCDGEGALGDPDDAKRTTAVTNHHKWAYAAKSLGCHSIRVNAQSEGTPEEQEKLAADGLRRLTEHCATLGINCIVENHGGLSSHGDWLARVMNRVGHPRCGTLPDFGNFYEYDRYQGVTDMMPFAKGVSAKSHEFDAQGNEVRTDYVRMLGIVKAAGYRGAIGVEYEGDKHSEADGIRLTKALLERLRVAPPAADEPKATPAGV
ncbi:MAG: sugar phosphate isomerase/epimerase family protein [Planctomycetota bacterium]|nr:sugar phosphate isomerase/epimerase family protein [Planctomycetota bacterium]